MKPTPKEPCPTHLSPRQRRAAALLGAGDRSKQQVAKDVGVHAGTMSRWLAREDFASLVAAETDQVTAVIRAASIRAGNEWVARVSQRVKQLVSERRERLTKL